MSTLVISDLHLGARTGVDRLREPDVLDALAAGLADVDRLVLLGDLIELRESAMHDVLAAARPVLERIGAALPGGAEIVVVGGNHDHRLLAPWLERRHGEDAAPLGIEQVIEPAAAGDAAAAVAEALAPASVRFAYPGIWLRDDVYATHGHYLDRHLTIPAFEPLSMRAVERVLRRRVAAMEPVDGYEAVMAPIYALMHELAQTAPPASPRTATH
ncbi:MAG TPA: metallophosphoesterase, partial [Solirubrobacteraceae bacterium]